MALVGYLTKNNLISHYLFYCSFALSKVKNRIHGFITWFHGLMGLSWRTVKFVIGFIPCPTYALHCLAIVVITSPQYSHLTFKSPFFLHLPLPIPQKCTPPSPRSTRMIFFFSLFWAQSHLPFSSKSFSMLDQQSLALCSFKQTTWPMMFLYYYFRSSQLTSGWNIVGFLWFT